MALMSHLFACLLLVAAWAQNQGPSIEDMLRDSSNTISSPSGVGGPVPSPSHSYSSNRDSIAKNLDSNHDSIAKNLNSLDAITHSNHIGSSAPKPDSDSIGGMMGGMAAMMGGGAARPKEGPDMFGRRPAKPMTISDMMNPGGGGGLFGGGAAKKKAGGGGGLPPMNPIMDQMLKNVEAKMPINQKKAMQGGAAAPISTESRLIVDGLVSAFMHKVRLSPGEKSCLEKNIATLTGDVVGTTEDIVKAVKALTHVQKGIPLSKALGGRAQGSLASEGMDAAMKLTSLVTLTTSLVKNCVRGDALKMLERAGKNLINMKYLGHRLLVSGVDIMHRLSDGIISFEHKDWHRFGQDIGIAMRKIVLSNSERGSRLPEGVPEESIIEETTAGLISGFFVRGAGVEITDSAYPDVDIQLDLHRCITGNHEFFKEIWLAMWNLIAELALSVNNHGGMENPFASMGSDEAQPKWMGELMVAMMQVPMALSRCHVDKESQTMMMEAIKSLQFVKMHFLFPQHILTADETTRRMAKAVQQWTNWNFHGFGKQLGIMLREFVLMMYPVGSGYPQKYSVDANGRLRRELVDVSSVKVVGQKFSNPFIATVACFGMLSSVVVALVGVRGLRTVNSASSVDDCADSTDVETNFLEVE